VKGKIEDVEAVRKGLKGRQVRVGARSVQVQPQQFPIQNYYLRVVGRTPRGVSSTKTIGTVFKDPRRAYVQDCPMK